jgi:putative ABC transport system permease protein
LEQRTKEICIRKIAGASLPGILFMILSSYSKLLLIAFVIAAPVGWWLMDLWLQDFAYRISPSVAVYIGAGLITFVIAALVTVYHASKVARINPVDVLRSE